ncbi:NAD(P)H-hydrate dehydratase [Microvirga tunisiensis]|uniref:Bifunctional NAD(P)H-hydrate repair enzyme n=1 Tax=Pannonibacter tanglangensis TaxID=2750084 RepID=A0A7X5J8L9_9HYPH|nr:NAD(P)H-hydrate dehydratase [Pannonibacter sp. XCT-53]
MDRDKGSGKGFGGGAGGSFGGGSGGGAGWDWSGEQAATALLTPAEMAEADRRTMAAGVSGHELMRRAGAAVARAAAVMRSAGQPVLVLCGPGNNGGDGYVAATLLKRWGIPVTLLCLGQPDQVRGDAAEAAAGWRAAGGTIAPLDPASFIANDRNAPRPLLVDALFGAGLSRPLDGAAAAAVDRINASALPVLAVDVPSGLEGATGRAAGPVVRATRTVTFARLKPGHVLLPGRDLCGETVLCDIGIGNETISDLQPKARLNGPAAWGRGLPQPARDTHKYARGAVLAVSGPYHATGAIRLAAEAALRAGAGLVSIACAPAATAALVPHLTAVMVRPLRDGAAWADLLADPRIAAAVIGPGAGLGEGVRHQVLDLVAAPAGPGLVLDADALSAFAGDRERLLGALRQRSSPAILTPHAGEFRRLFPQAAALDRLAAARAAAREAGAVVVLKGPDTVIAAPDGRAFVNANAPAALATAGSGDVLAGLAAGLLAQAVAPFEAAAMAVHVHGAAGALAGAGMTAEDLLPAVPRALARLAAG